ncbi:hypothetical protein [Vibrio sp. D431a]|uniref:hypothetical protein n=1 Tax=Vibrio sp. D431a TaxID=2837388 RepID=UPI0025526622|nr:hypothetical protein [Vibrio sp. D431a]MDK9790021.1 hypothetical protein [Vibrio sp. D431a]
MEQQIASQISLERLIKAGVQDLDGKPIKVTSFRDCDFLVKMEDTLDRVVINWIPSKQTGFSGEEIVAAVYIQSKDGSISLDCDYQDNLRLSDLKTSSVQEIHVQNELAYNARKAALSILEVIAANSQNLFVSCIAELQAEIERVQEIKKQADDEQKRVFDNFTARHEQISRVEAKSIVKILQRQADERAMSETIEVLLFNSNGKTEKRGLHCASSGTSKYYWFESDGSIVPENKVTEFIEQGWKEK